MIGEIKFHVYLVAIRKRNFRTVFKSLWISFVFGQKMLLLRTVDTKQYKGKKGKNSKRVESSLLQRAVNNKPESKARVLMITIMENLTPAVGTN